VRFCFLPLRAESRANCGTFLFGSHHFSGFISKENIQKQLYAGFSGSPICPEKFLLVLRQGKRSDLHRFWFLRYSAGQDPETPVLLGFFVRRFLLILKEQPEIITFTLRREVDSTQNLERETSKCLIVRQRAAWKIWKTKCWVHVRCAATVNVRNVLMTMGTALHANKIAEVFRAKSDSKMRADALHSI